MFVTMVMNVLTGACCVCVKLIFHFVVIIVFLSTLHRLRRVGVKDCLALIKPWLRLVLHILGAKI